MFRNCITFSGIIPNKFGISLPSGNWTDKILFWPWYCGNNKTSACLYLFDVSPYHFLRVSSPRAICPTGWLYWWIWGIRTSFKKRKKAESFLSKTFKNKLMAPPWSNWQRIGSQITATWVWTLAWAHLKGVSSLTLLHYLRRLLSPFSLLCAQKWP